MNLSLQLGGAVAESRVDLAVAANSPAVRLGASAGVETHT
jgi:hypothetical protein